MIDTNIEKAVEAGTFAQGVEEVKADSIKMVSRDTLYADEYTGAETELIEMLHRTKTNPIGPVEAVDKARLAAGPDTRYELVVNLRSKRAGIVMPAPAGSDDGATRTPGTAPATDDENLDVGSRAGPEPVERNHPERLANAWDDEVKTLPDYEETRFWLVTGLLLPIWHRLPSEDMRVRRVTTDDGEPLVGRLLTMGEVNKTLENFGRTESVVVSADEIWEQMETTAEQRSSFTEGLRLVKRRVMGIERMELSNAFGNTLETLKSLGCRTEVIYYQTRIFAPSIRVLKKVIARYPLIGGGG